VVVLAVNISNATIIAKTKPNDMPRNNNYAVYKRRLLIKHIYPYQLDWLQGFNPCSPIIHTCINKKEITHDF
jgi:hypothetical protein